MFSKIKSAASNSKAAVSKAGSKALKAGLSAVDTAQAHSREVVSKANSSTVEAGRSAVDAAQAHIRKAASAAVESGAAEQIRTRGSEALAGAVRMTGKASEAAGDAASRAGQAAAAGLAAARDQIRKQLAVEISLPSVAFVDAVASSLESGKGTLKGAFGRLVGSEQRLSAITQSSVALATAVATAFDKIQASSPAFQDLTPTLQSKLRLAGLQDGWRTLPGAEAFFTETIPSSVRNLGESSIWEFLSSKHASHINSVKNFAELALEKSNIVWERATSNFARGSADMTGHELARANVENLVGSLGIVAANAIETAAFAGCVGLALETVVALGENVVYVYAGERSVGDAALDVGKKAIEKGGIAALGGAAVSAALALGAGPAISAMAPVLIPVGATVFVVGATKRITAAVRTCKDRESLETLLLGAPPGAV